MVRSLPLRSGFFNPPLLSQNEEVELLNWTRTIVPALYHSDIEWTILQEKKGVQILEDRQKGGLTYSIKSVATVKATLAEVMNMFTTNSTAEFRSLFQFLSNDYFLDAAQLYQREFGETETLGMKWVAVGNKSGMNPMVHNLDFCMVEYSGLVSADVIGGDEKTAIGVCLFESIEQPECPNLRVSHRLDRGYISKCGFVFIQKGEGYLDAQFTCCIRQPPSQRSQRRLNRQIVLQWAESVGTFEEYLGRKRISRGLTLRKNPIWVEDKDRHCCQLCLKSFSNTRRKHHCRACGEIICRNCSMYQSVDLQSVGPTTLRVCKACMDNTKAHTLQSQMSQHTDETLRDAVQDCALTLVPNVPDLVGIAWLRQIAARDPSKRTIVQQLLEHLPHLSPASSEPIKTSEVDIYDTLCDLAAQTLSCTYAAVNLIDENRQWFKSAIHIQESDVPRDFSFCEYPVKERRPLIVMDALLDSRMKDHPFVTGPLQVRFLAAAPLFTTENVCVGAVCVLDTEPRESLEENQIATMQNLAHLAMVMVQERRQAQLKLGPRTVGSDLVLLKDHEMTLAARARQEDSVLKEQMVQLLQKASQVRDQVTQQSRSAVQQAGLQSCGE